MPGLLPYGYGQVSLPGRFGARLNFDEESLRIETSTHNSELVDVAGIDEAARRDMFAAPVMKRLGTILIEFREYALKVAWGLGTVRPVIGMQST